MKKFNLRIIACLMMAVMISACFGHVGTAMAAKAAHTGELTVAGEDDYWGQHDTTMAEVLGDVALEDVTYIRFYSNAGFVLGYNNGAVDWYQTDKVTEYVMEDLNKDPNKWTLAIIANEFTGTKVTVKWEVYTIGTPADNKADTEKAGETIALETIVNPSWGVYSNLIPSDTLAKYPDGVVFDIALEVEGDYALLTPINDTTNWPKLIKETAGVEFNSDDGEFIVFGADTKNLKMTLTAKGVKTVLATGSGVRFQGNQLKFKEVTLTAVPPKATPTPKPTATPIPTPTPVPVTEELYKTVGTVLLVTEDMVENGKVVIERAQYNSIIIPANLNADVTLKTVKAEEVVVEGGADYTVTLYYCDVEKVDVTAPEVKVMTVAELNEALQAEDADADAIIEQFQADLAAKKAADLAQVELVTTYFTEVKEINVKASAKIDANAEQCEVNKINVAVADVDQTQTVLLKDYNGAVAADLERADGAFASMFTLELENAKLSVLDVTGADSSCFIEGEASVVDALNVANAANIALNAATGKVTVAEEADGAKVRVYSSVNEVTVKSDATSIVLPTCAKIGNAVVEGNNVKVYGYGKLDTAVITGTGANVAVYGTAVDGENDSTPPAAMLAMSPQKAPQKSDRPVKPEDDAIYTFTYAEYAKVKEESNGALSPSFQFELRDYGLEGLQAKDKVRLTVTFNGSGDYHACISANKWDGTEAGVWHSIQDMSTSGRTTLSGVFEVPHGESWVNAQAQIFWMPENGADIKVESIVVEKVVEEENEPIHTFEWVEPVDDGNGGLKMDIPEFAFLIKDYLPDVQVKEKVKITVNLTGDVYFNGQIGANTYKEGAQYGEWTVFEQFESPTVLTGEIEVPHDYADVKIQMWWMDETEKGVTVDSITVQRVETSGGGNGSGTGYVAGPAYSGTHVFDPHQEYWLMEEIALADLFGPVNQSDATSVILYCADKNIGYQHGLADETFDQKAGGRYYNINADEIANYFQFIFNDSSATETTLYWEVYTEELIVGHEDSVTIDGVANEEWNAGETSITTLEGLLGEVPLEEAEFIIFECPVNMIVQYRAPGSQYPGFYGSTLVKMNLADVDFDFDDFFFKLGLNVRDAGTQTISWTVYTKATE